MNLSIYHNILHGAIRPGQIDDSYLTEIANLLDRKPEEFKQIEEHLQTVLSPVLTLEFNDENILNINNLLSEIKYTPIDHDNLKIHIETDEPVINTIKDKFYVHVLSLEAQRVKLRLLKYTELIQDDICSRQHIKGVLSQIKRFIKASIEREDPIYKLLKTELIELYFELTLIFESLFSSTDFQSFDNFYLTVVGQPATSKEIFNYKKAEIICRARHAIKFNSSEIPTIYADVVQLYNTSENDLPLKQAAENLENYIIIENETGTYPTLLNLSDNTYISDRYDRIKNNYMQQLEKLQFGIERANMIEGFMQKLELTIPGLRINSDNTKSIPRLLFEFLDKQYNAYIKEPSASFPVKQDNADIRVKEKPKPTIKPMKVGEKLNIATTHLAFLDGINPKNQERFMLKENYNRLVEYVKYLITENKIPNNIKKIPTGNINKSWYVFTLYLIHKSIYSQINDVWIEFIQKVFEGYSKENIKFKTLKTKFSVEPSGYGQAKNKSIKK